MSKIDLYRNHFDEATRDGFHDQPEAVRQLRQLAMTQFEQLGFPTTRMEAWRNTNLAQLAKSEFLAPDANIAIEQSQLQPFYLDNSIQVVVVAGRFRPDLSSLDGLPREVGIIGLAEAITQNNRLVLTHLGRYADYREEALTALNTAFLSDGVLIHVPEKVTIDRPINVICLSSNRNHTATVTHPRTLVVAGRTTQVTLAERFVRLSGGPTFTNAVTEIVAGPGSIVDYTRLQLEPDDAHHIATVQVHQEADSRVELHTITIGGGLVRNNLNSTLAAEGAEVSLNGLYLVRESQHVDNHTRIDHAAPHCTSAENYKGILDDQGHAVFNGRIIVHQDAQKTDATQSNQNLMLSDQALVNTNPQLEIYADDVKCRHGSTVGQIDEDIIFYFLTRGIDRDAARRLLVHGFTREITNRIENQTIREFVNELIDRWFPNGQEGAP